MHFFPLAQANEYTFKHITSANGLPQNYVRSVIQDSRGFMWFTTFDGIVRYDGYSFKTYRRYDNGLDTGLICCTSPKMQLAIYGLVRKWDFTVMI